MRLYDVGRLRAEEEDQDDEDAAEVYILQDVPFFFPSSRPVNEFSSLGFFAVKGKKSKYEYKNRSNFNIFR